MRDTRMWETIKFVTRDWLRKGDVFYNNQSTDFAVIQQQQKYNQRIFQFHYISIIKPSHFYISNKILLQDASICLKAFAFQRLA